MTQAKSGGLESAAGAICASATLRRAWDRSLISSQTGLSASRLTAGLTRQVEIIQVQAHECAQSTYRSGLLYNAASRWTHVCVSRWAIGSRHVWWHAWFEQCVHSDRRLDLTHWWISHCLWSVYAHQRFHLQRRNGRRVFHDTRGECYYVDGEVLPDLQRRTSVFQ